ncbi:PLP-dependent aminotransferase family protein [Candidatus Cytomitobacter primus]|uniref:Phosphoserine transaminase n=1 Tax=Candidatus Cytomitobacter primus TaxID=2066024 RepID=A0A5C0UFR4_9PROT|nr:hypothetical protein [Candidatus Cytomitobacter primus]QEK38567.1 hypothetical protein FZC34_01420 [Candidatus Cytomitobacter primus]
MFCSGPTKKYAEFSSYNLLEGLGRSHRSDLWENKIQDIYSLIKKSLQIPDNYQIGFINGSATAAIDSLFWNFLGSKPCHVLETGVFSKRWGNEIFNVLKIPGKSIQPINLIKQTNSYQNNFDNLNNTNYGPNVLNNRFNYNYDFVFTMVETTNGSRWFDKNVLNKIQGLKFCDATSAVFCENIDWNLLDYTAFSFQKALGAEAGIGCVVLSPKAIDHMNNHNPKFPTPRFLQINHSIFQGKLNNTPSLISLNDIAINLSIFLNKGGLPNAIKQCKLNQSQIMDILSPTLQCINCNHINTNHNANAILCMEMSQWGNNLINHNIYSDKISKNIIDEEKWRIIHKVAKQSEQFGIFDIAGHPEDTPCWRFWIGPTIDKIQSYINQFIDIIRDAI